MSEMIVQVRNKILRRIGGVNHFVSHNKDYTIQFQFDESWDNVRTKMAVFAYEDGEYGSEIFDGDTCNVPEFPREGRILIGVKAGEDLSTELLCIPVCKSADDVITDEYDEPDPKIYEQILDIINNLWNGGTTVYPSPVKFLASPSTAKVGDLIRVKEVDENGDVTRTEGFDVGVELEKKINAPQVAQVGEVLTVEEVDADGKPKKWKTAPAAAEQKQADWNQNDETAADYVKNRPFYERIINGYVYFTYDKWWSLNLRYPFTISLKVNGNEYKDVSGSTDRQYVYYHCDNYLITIDTGEEIVFGDQNVDELELYVENYQEVHTLSDEYIPNTIARTEQIVNPDWNIVDESVPGAILNKPNIGWGNIYSRSGGVIPTFTIPSGITGWIIKIKNVNIENYSEGDEVYINQPLRTIEGTIIQGNNLMIRGYKSSGFNNGTIVSVVTKGGTDYMTQIVAYAIDFFGWNETKIKIYGSGGKTITCNGFGFVAV